MRWFRATALFLGVFVLGMSRPLLAQPSESQPSEGSGEDPALPEIAPDITPEPVAPSQQPGLEDIWPGVYYSWTALPLSMSQCLDQAERTVVSAGLEGILADDVSVSGHHGNTSAVFVCMEVATGTNVMIIAASENPQSAIALRDYLRNTFSRLPLP